MSESTLPGGAGRKGLPQEDAAAATAAQEVVRVERRARADRRARPTRFWDSLRGWRRRRRGRRSGESENTYVDRYEHHDVGLLLGIFSLNLFDAAFTLVWLGRGGAEGNPVMDWALRAGDAVFLFQKCFVAAAWLFILVVHKNFRAARYGLWMLFAVYALLALYHAFLHLFAEPLPLPSGPPA